MGLKIGAREVGPGHPCYIVAEVGLAHEGSVGMAHAFVNAVADTGADAIKFQCHTGQADQPWRARPPWSEDETRADYWGRTSFRPAQWHKLAMHAMASRVGRGLDFLCSPFSVEAVQILEPIVPAWKIASGQVTNDAMLEAAGMTGKPAIISGGLTGWDGAAMYAASAHFSESAWLHSVSLYPTPPSAMDLSRLRHLVGWPPVSGLSDHSGTIYPGIAAAALGAHIIEVHVTMSRHAYGPDTASSLTIEELRQLVKGVRFVERAMQPMSEDARRAVAKAREVYMA